MIFQSPKMSSAHFTLKNGKNLAKNEEKSCPEIFTIQKLKFSATLVKKNAIKTVRGGRFLDNIKKWDKKSQKVGFSATDVGFSA